MAETPSSMLPLGTPMPSIALRNVVDGASVDVRALATGKRGTLVMFLCNHCPFVVHIRSELARVANEAIDRGFAAVAINSNDVESYPQDGPDPMKRLAIQEKWRFPFLLDETQDVARAFGAACTPDLYLFDAEQRLAYRGQFDDSRPSNGKPVNGRDLRAALDAVASGRAPAADQKASVGCSIKWSRRAAH
jgi:hypothetical protein